MKTSKVSRLVLGAIAILALSMSSGCLSYWSYKSAEDEIRRERVYASGDQNAIKNIRMGVSGENAIRAMRIGDDGVGIGIDVSNWQALTKHPVRQIGAAIVDAAMMYGAYEGVKSLSDSGNDDDKSNYSAGDNSTINVNSGNGGNGGDGGSGGSGGNGGDGSTGGGGGNSTDNSQ